MTEEEVNYWWELRKEMEGPEWEETEESARAEVRLDLLWCFQQLMDETGALEWGLLSAQHLRDAILKVHDLEDQIENWHAKQEEASRAQWRES